MRMYKAKPKSIPFRKIREVNISLDEKPTLPSYIFRSKTERVKFIKTIEKEVRSSFEYKSLIKFIKTNTDWNQCEVLKNIFNGNGKKYTIEIHHEPFTLFDIVEIIMAKYNAENIPLDICDLASDVTELHYKGMVGLIPLTKTMHEEVGTGKIFIPLQRIYHDWFGFYRYYESYISDNIKEKIEIKVNLSIEADKIRSNILNPEFSYIDIQGFDFPVIPDEWGKLIIKNKETSLIEIAKKEAEEYKETLKLKKKSKKVS